MRRPPFGFFAKEVAGEPKSGRTRGRPRADSPRVRHATRNRLNSAVLAVEMLRLQIAAGNTSAAQEPLDKVVDELRARPPFCSRKPPRRRHCRPKPDGLEGPSRRGQRQREQSPGGLSANDGIRGRHGWRRADALDYLRSHDRPDVVLLDMLMPRCDGPTTIGRIRRDPNLEGVKNLRGERHVAEAV